MDLVFHFNLVAFIALLNSRVDSKGGYVRNWDELDHQRNDLEMSNDVEYKGTGNKCKF